MAQTIHAVFDGRALRPEEPADLELNKRYLLTVEEESGTSSLNSEQTPYPLATLLNCATDLGVSDSAERHDSRLIRTPVLLS